MRLVDESIRHFIALLRAADISMSPKAHILEEHIIPFLERWHIGLAYLGEQGGEKLHSRYQQVMMT
jgi:hypothetical protein